MDLAYRLFNISWDGSSHRGESWENFQRRVARILQCGRKQKCVQKISKGWRENSERYGVLIAQDNKLIFV